MKFFIIDGSGFLYRAYYAYPQISDKDGHNINVVYGFFRMLLKIIGENPDYFVIARDSPVKTIRHESFPEYKANRKKMEDDFKRQIPLTQELTNALGIPNLVVDTYEADDIIATLTKKYKSDQDLIIDIYSSDKDLKQLLDRNVFCIDPLKGIRTDTKLFLQEFMFDPKYILDYLALTGDSADNIKGVAGIGPKKASELIKKYNDIDGIYSHIDEISGDIKDKLIQNKEEAYTSRDLIQLHDIETLNEETISNFKLDLDFNKYKKILIEEYGFNSFEKPLNELKKKFETPTQNSLF
ncbi:5'-3' exonuclease [Candidatus Gracilibacteria bacterium]|nr:5'-3' exonuclease [Candidatus Gracilibacteria bacterium]